MIAKMIIFVISGNILDMAVSVVQYDQYICLRSMIPEQNGLYCAEDIFKSE